MIWNIPTCKITGTYHLSQKIKGQDYIKVTLANFNDIAIVVMTDGVSSAKLASTGSRGLAWEVAGQLERRGADLLGWKDEEIIQWLSNVSIEWLEAKSKELECLPRDLDTTLMIFMSDGEKFLAGSIGDGLIGRISSNGQQEVLLEPEHGQSINVSYFVATSDFTSHFRIARGRIDSDSVYFMMTDGTCECLYDYRTKAYADALPIFCEWTRKYQHSAVQDAIFKVGADLFKEITTDDCALALIYGKNNR